MNSDKLDVAPCLLVCCSQTFSIVPHPKYDTQQRPLLTNSVSSRYNHNQHLLTSVSFDRDFSILIAKIVHVVQSVGFKGCNSCKWYGYMNMCFLKTLYTVTIGISSLQPAFLTAFLGLGRMDPDMSLPFTQSSSRFKLIMPSINVIVVWRITIKLSIEHMLNCNCRFTSNKA